MSKKVEYKNISLKEMFENLVKLQLNEDCKYDTFYYMNGFNEFVEITEVDLMDSRFRTIDCDFSEYNWESEKSNIYVREDLM